MAILTLHVYHFELMHTENGIASRVSGLPLFRNRSFLAAAKVGVVSQFIGRLLIIMEVLLYRIQIALRTFAAVSAP